MISENSYTLQSSNTVYQLTISSENCTDKPHCIPQCNDLQCRYLCRHMVKCSCLDYLHGHLCKLTHKVNPYHVHEYMHVYTHFNLDMKAKKRAILTVLDERVKRVNDGSCLDRGLALLSHASTSIKTEATKKDHIKCLKRKTISSPHRRTKHNLDLKRLQQIQEERHNISH